MSNGNYTNDQDAWDKYVGNGVSPSAFVDQYPHAAAAVEDFLSDGWMGEDVDPPSWLGDALIRYIRSHV